MLRDTLLDIYNLLYERFGAQNWWPAKTGFEVIVGAILTQATSWRNVEKAIANLKDAGVLSLDGLLEIDVHALAELIRPSGYYNAKARKLKAIASFISERSGPDLDGLFAARSMRSAKICWVYTVSGLRPQIPYCSTPEGFLLLW